MQLTGSNIDLSGDTGVVGRVKATSGGLEIDLKGQHQEGNHVLVHNRVIWLPPYVNVQNARVLAVKIELTILYPFAYFTHL